ncbi:MAG: PQQ-binding-like beta-propeller repeat protein, partial [Candidatus Aegiribacteria sp.]|nr:PQQ-binding-like beta-propeller repeat protein [Candidatus Aegiribacteria sp.]
MPIGIFITAILFSTINLTITEPVDGEIYNGDWLSIRAIVENENEPPDSVHYTLNGEPVIQISRLNTDWPTYMQNYQNHGYSESPAPTDNTILWTAPVTGYAHEFPTPVVVNGMVYYTSDSLGSGTADSLYALDAATGELVWKYDTGHADDAVTVMNGRVYSPSDSLFCFDAETGVRIWANGIADHSGSTPIVVNDRVFCASNTFGPTVSCLDASNGNVIWSQSLPSTMTSCMALWNGMLFVPTFHIDAALYALDTDDGSIIWQNDDAYIGFWDSSPVVVDGMIYINGISGHTLAINAINGNTEWDVDLSPGNADATSAYFDGRLFFAHNGPPGPYYCLDATDGSTLWTAPYNQHGSSGIADGLVFFGEYHPVADSASVIALDCETGNLVWSYQTGGEWFAGSPSITDGVVYMPAHDGLLYAFGTGLKYTYLDELYARVGSNELIATSFDIGVAVATDTVNFTVTQTGITPGSSSRFTLRADPNPFYSTASISFELSESAFISIDVYDLSGRIVTTLENSVLPAGEHFMQWNGINQNGEPVSAGLYLCRIQSGGISETTGLCLLR